MTLLFTIITGGDTSIGGLTDGTTYFVIRVHDNFIKLGLQHKKIVFNLILY